MATTQLPATTPLRDGTHDFDFLHGTWSVRNRRLRAVLAGSDEWYEFDGKAVQRPLWGGQANIEEYDAAAPSGRIQGLALRLYNPLACQWTIHWSSSATGTLDQPLTGAFDGERGTFYGTDVVEGRQIQLRFIWASLHPGACRWEQAFSADGGVTWETNWIMDFTRTA
jgi:hypothetical protein